MEYENKKYLQQNSWKKTNEKYLFELQKFLDLLDNINQEELKKKILYQFMQYDKTIEDIVAEMMKNKS